MKKIGLLTILAIAFAGESQAQLSQKLSSIIGLGSTEQVQTDTTTTKTKTTTSSSILSSLNITESEANSGIKEALINGVTKGVALVSKEDGYFGDNLIKIAFPEDVQIIEKKLRAVGMGSLVDQAVLSMNRAAEDAASTATDIFVGAIKEMTVTDAINIVQGDDHAATTYLQNHTTSKLTEEFNPIINASLEKVDATKYWGDMINAYNKLPLVKKQNPDLGQYVTEKAISGLFVKIADEEKAIRENPTERTSDLLKKVFH